jgi:hypothetical protein
MEQIEATRDFLTGLKDGEGESMDAHVNSLCDMALATLKSHPTPAKEKP